MILNFSDGFSYEKDALEEWFDGGNATSPMTNLEISTEIIENTLLQEKIEEYLHELDFNLFDFESKDDEEEAE